MHCSACGAVSRGAGRCGACGAVMPLPGEELVHDRPVAAAVPLDRRGPRDGGPTAGPPSAMGKDLWLDRREEPRPPVVSPLDAVRPMAEAAAHLLRHVAAVAPLAREEAPVPAAPGGQAVVAAEPGLPDEAWRILEADAVDEEFEVTEEIVMPPAAPAWRRLLAWTIDGSLLLIVPLVALAAATRGVADEDGVALRLVDLLQADGAVQGAAVALAALTAFVYLTLSSFLGGRTPGAALAGLGVVSCASGDPPSLGRAALRAALAVAGTFACFAGPAWALFDGRGQALHDKLAGTVVMADR